MPCAKAATTYLHMAPQSGAGLPMLPVSAGRSKAGERGRVNSYQRALFGIAVLWSVK